MPDASGTSSERPTSRFRVLKTLAGILILGGVIAYPIGVYGLLSSPDTMSTGRVGWLLVPFGISLVLAARSNGPRSRLAAPVLAVILIVGGIFLNRLQPLLLVPVVINGVFLFSFATTLWSDRPIIERFARLQDKDLTLAEVAWCRGWTITWSVFFAVNIAVALGLGLANQLRLWAVYNGLLTYIVMACLFASEYTLRKYRFGRYKSHPLDRFLQWCFERRRASPP